VNFIKDLLLISSARDLDDFVTDEQFSEFEKGITLTHDNIKTINSDNPLKLFSTVTFNKYKNPNRIDIDVKEEDTQDRVASFTFYVDDPASIPSQRMGLIEALTSIRFASEVVKPIIVQTSNPVVKGLDELLTTYAGVKIIIEGDAATDRPNLRELYKGPVILFSGGIDSASLLFKNYGNQVDALTFYHGQPSFTHGQWNEKTAPKKLVGILNDLHNTTSELTYSKHRFKVYKHNKVWAKSFRNLFFGIHGALIYPNRKLLLGCHRDDVEHDCNENLMRDFRKLTGIPLYAPTIHESRDTLIKQLVEQTGSLHPYLYASTTSCQLIRFHGKKHIFCGSCHSCLLRINAIKYEVDPRFSNFNDTFESSPEELNVPVHQVWRTNKFSWSACTKWYNGLSPIQKEDFVKDIEFVKALESKKTVPVSPLKKNPDDFIVRFIGGNNHTLVKELDRYKEVGDTVYIPFAGSGREVYRFSKQGKTVYSADTQYLSLCLIKGVLGGQGDVNIDFTTRQAKGWASSHPFLNMSPELARFIDGYAIKYADNLYAKAVLVQSIINATYRGYLRNFMVNDVDEFKKIMMSSHSKLRKYHGSCPNVIHHFGSYEDLNIKKADLVFIDPPKIVDDFDVYSQHFTALNSILMQQPQELPLWSSEGYLDHFEKLFQMKSKKILFVYTTGVEPGLEEVKLRLEKVGGIEETRQYKVGGRMDYLYEIDKGNFKTQEVEKSYDPEKAVEAATLGEYSEMLHDKKESMFRQEMSSFLNKEFYQIEKLTQSIPGYQANLFRYAISNLFNDPERIVKIGNFEEHGREEEKIPVEYVSFSTGEEVVNGFLSAIMFLQPELGQRIVLGIHPRWGGAVQLDLYGTDRKQLSTLLNKINHFVKENNFLKGKKLSFDGGFMTLSKVTWDDVILPKNVKTSLQRYVLDHIAKVNELEERGLPTKKGILLVGPPGNGKTMIGKVLAASADCTFIWVPYHDPRVDDFTYKDIFQMARDLAPSIVFMEDIASQGGLDRRQVVSRDLGELLNMLDGIEENSKVVTIATENYPDLLDAALRNRPGRFDVIIKLNNPEEEQREALLERFLPELGKERIQVLAKQTNGFSNAHLRELTTRILIAGSEVGTDTEFVTDIIQTFNIGKPEGDMIDEDE